MLNFTLEEYKERLARVKAAMEKAGIDVLFTNEPANMYYVTGYDAGSHYVPQGIIISLDEDMPVWFGRLMDEYSVHVTTWLDDNHIQAYPDKYLWKPKELHAMDFLSDYLKKAGYQNKKIGVEKDTYYFTAYWFEVLQRNLPDATFVDATGLVNWTRIVKSKQELEYMGIAARIVEKAVGNAIDKIDAGVRENAVGAQLFYDEIMGTGEFGGECLCINSLIPAGDRTAAAHMTWSPEGVYEKGQVVYMETAGSYRRYHSPMSRTVFVGEAPEVIKDTAKICVEGLNAAIESAKAGVTCEEVEAVWSSTIGKYGLHKESRMGYSIGCAFPPVWIENTMFIQPGEKTVLQPDMTFHFMPGLWLEGYGVAITETVRVTEKGGETITKFPRKLFVKP